MIVYMNKKYLFLIIIIVIIVACGIFLFFNNSKKSENNTNSNNTARLATTINEENANTTVDANKEAVNSTENAETTNQEEGKKETTPPKEEEISSYSTPLKSKASGRLNNIRITCKALDGTIVSVGETFSFCNTLGPVSSAKGYEKADVIINGEIEQALGGGNCQVSSTLYNAVLAVPDLAVTERHEHGKDVSYVPEGKDAAVSYGSLDFKFRNDSSHDIKMYLASDDEKVSVTLVKLIY